MKKLFALGFTSLLALAAASPASAATVFVSFEQATLSGGGAAYAYITQPFGGSPNVPVGFGTIPGVTFSGASGVQANGSAFGFANATDGTKTAFIQSYNGVGGSISVDLSGLTPLQRYFVSFDAARRAYSDPTGASNPFSVTVGGVTTLFDTTSTAFTPFAFSFIAQGNDVLKFDGSTLGNDATVGLDSITVAVPEPATWMMMIAGFGMIGFGLRSRSKPTVRVTYA